MVTNTAPVTHVRHCLPSWSVAFIAFLLSTIATAGQLTVHPRELHLTGLDRFHGVIVSFTDDQGQVVDVTQRATFVIDKPEIATVDRQGMVEARGDGTAKLLVSLDTQQTAVPLVVTASGDQQPPSFKQDILPILTRSGCNTGGCHGKLAGQNGFRLSLRGYAPEWDYGWITQEVNGRRIDLAFPDQSLLVTKPSGGLPHEGGVRFRQNSRMWQTLRDWVAARAPAPVADEPDAARLEILPGDRRLALGETQQLLVRAHYANGRVRDVTWLAQFFSNEPTTLTVTPTGSVKALRHGQAIVRIHFQRNVEVVRLTIPFPQTVATDQYTVRQNAIDGPLFEKLQQLHLPPVGLCTDETFLRRVYLDAAGILPTPAEVVAFQLDTRSDKRSRVIDALLERPEFTDYWTLQLADLLQNRKERDHDVRGQKGVKSFHRWLREQIATNRSWSDIAKEVLLAKGDVVAQPQGGYYLTVVGEFGRIEESELPDSIAQAFLGTRIGCARCHNHPLERYTQDDFYHFAACFAKVNLDRQNPQSGASAVTTTSRDEREQRKSVGEAAKRLSEACLSQLPEETKQQQIGDRQRELDEQLRKLDEIRLRAPGVTQPRTAQWMVPQTLDGVALKIDPGSDPRIPFTEWAIASDSFSGAMVNRLWKHFFAVGLVEPVDDLRASNPPSNPELWKLLNDEFRSHHFDLRYMIRLILNSRAYQLDSANTAGNQLDTRYYSHYYARRLPAEVLLDAIASATQVPHRFPGYPVGLRATQIPDPAADSYFLTLFGRSNRVTACACERKGEVTLPQLLHLSNDESLMTDIRSPNGRLVHSLQDPDSAAVTRELFLATVSRYPSEAEQAAVNAALATDNRDEVFADLFWALVNSKEFAFNH